MPPTMNSIILKFHEYGHRSSMHGLSHMYHTADTCRRWFWFVLTIVGTGACLFHVIMTVENFLDTPVTSVLIDDAVKAEFPDVTFCNLKPMSESLGSYYSDVVHHHFEQRYGFFENYWPEERKRRINESRVDYNRRLRGIFERYLQIFWVSDDSRDLGMMDKVMVLHCSFNGIPCGDKNFSLVQSYRYWNCYTFSPNTQYRYASSGHMEDTGLNVILYSDSNFQESIYDIQAKYRIQKQDEDEMSRPYSLKEYLTSGGGTFNEILSGGRYEVEGIRIWLHVRTDHPMLSNIYNDVQNGMSAMIDVDQTQYLTLNQPERECTNEPYDTIQYTTSFGVNPQVVRKRKYTKTDREFIVEAKQHYIYSQCGCFSHHYPFHADTKQLCYHVSEQESVNPPEALIKYRIPCHDKYVVEAEKKSYDFIKLYRHHKQCKYTKFVLFKESSTWPRSDEHVSFVNEYIIPKMLNGSEYLGDDEHPHHIFNFSDPGVAALVKKQRSHEELALINLINQDCYNRTNETVGHNLDTMWCLDKVKMAYNVLRVIIKPTSPAAAKYEEKFSYEWPEALSEIGGVFGLWVGMSLLTFFEFIELVYLMATSQEAKPGAMVFIEGLPQQGLAQLSVHHHRQLSQLLLTQLSRPEEPAASVTVEPQNLAPPSLTWFGDPNQSPNFNLSPGPSPDPIPNFLPAPTPDLESAMVELQQEEKPEEEPHQQQKQQLELAESS